MGMFRPMPTPKRAMPAVARVPQLVPETTDITVQMMQVATRKIWGLRSLRPQYIKVGMVPEAIHTPTRMPVSIRMMMGTPMPLIPAPISVSISSHFTPLSTTKIETKVAESKRVMVVSRERISFPTMMVPRDRTTASNALAKDRVFFSVVCIFFPPSY